MFHYTKASRQNGTFANICEMFETKSLVHLLTCQLSNNGHRNTLETERRD